MRSKARADHHKPAPLPGLKGARGPSQQLRLRRSHAPTLLYCSNDSPNMRGYAISSNRNILLVSVYPSPYPSPLTWTGPVA
eukprot:6439589-Pyramimonas_sp.AAC.1